MDLDKQISNHIISNRWKLNLAVLIPPIAVLIFILIYGVNSPFNDDFYYLHFFRHSAENGFNIIDALAFRVNEHRAVIPLLVECFIWMLSNCNNRIVLFVSWLTCVVGYLLLVKYIIKTNKSIYLVLIISPLFFTSKFSFFYFWAQCGLVWSFTILFSLSSFYYYHFWILEGKRIYLYLALVFAVLDSFSSAAGILVWIAYFVATFLLFIIDGKDFIKRYLLGIIELVLVSIVCISLYFYDWHGFITPRPGNIEEVIKGFLSNVLCFAVNNDGNGIVPIIGASIISIIAMSTIALFRKKVVEKYLFEILMTGYFFGGMIVQSYRVSVSNMMVSQYALMPTMFLVGGIMIIKGCISEMGFKSKIEAFRLMAWGLWLFLCIISILNIDVLFGDARIHVANAYVVQNNELVPTQIFEKYTTIKKDTTFYDDLLWAENKGLFLFAGSREYDYPFDDYYMADQLDMISLPKIETVNGQYSIDFVNGKDPRTEEITVMSEDGQFYVDGWALDDTSNSVPSFVYLKINEKYFCLKQTARDDVSSAFGNENLKMCGCIGYIPIDTLIPGSYPVELFVVSADGQRYYRASICYVKIV